MTHRLLIKLIFKRKVLHLASFLDYSEMAY